MFALAAAPAALAHGPTVRVSYSGVIPEKLAIHAGDVVHFENANASAGTCTILADDGVFASPPLARAEGWHHTFSEPGTYGFFVEEFPSARGTIIVVEKDDSGD